MKCVWCFSYILHHPTSFCAAFSLPILHIIQPMVVLEECFLRGAAQRWHELDDDFGSANGLDAPQSLKPSRMERITREHNVANVHVQRPAVVLRAHTPALSCIRCLPLEQQCTVNPDTFRHGIGYTRVPIGSFLCVKKIVRAEGYQPSSSLLFHLFHLVHMSSSNTNTNTNTNGGGSSISSVAALDAHRAVLRRQLGAQYQQQLARLDAAVNQQILQIQRNVALSVRTKQQQLSRLRAQYNSIVRQMSAAYQQQLRAIDAEALKQPVASRAKRALTVGINYRGTSSALFGCIDDCLHMQTFLQEQLGFAAANIDVLTDDTPRAPTKANILAALRRLLQSGQANDLLVFTYSGHGSYTADRNGDEADGRDEMLVSVDNYGISDDELKSVIQSSLRPGATLLCLFDSCHSGTALDLKYSFAPDGSSIDVQPQGLRTSGNVILISGCADAQTSAEGWIDNRSQGAMTWAFLKAAPTAGVTSWRSLLSTMRTLLSESAFEQTPQLSADALIDLDAPVFWKD